MTITTSRDGSTTTRPHDLPPAVPLAPMLSGMDLQVDYPELGTAVVSVSGVVDDVSLLRLDELMANRLASVIDALVVDLSAVTFISVSGLELLRKVYTRADSRGMSARLVVATHQVYRALQVAGLLDVFKCHTNVTEALTKSPDGRFGSSGRCPA